MASVLLSFSGFLNIEKNYSDSVVLVLQYRITFACIMTFVLISGTYTDFRDHISCTTSAQVNLKVVENYCMVNPTIHQTNNKYAFDLYYF